MIINKSISLIGFMGCGKSTVSQKLAKALQINCIDTDGLIEITEGQSIREIFSTRGESYFREREKNVLLSLLEEPKPSVLALGGGTPCFHNNMKHILDLSVAIYLEVSPQTLVKRLEKERDKRPLLKNQNNLLEYIENTLSIRNPIYKKAHYTINGEQDLNIIVEEIKEIIQGKNKYDMQLAAFLLNILEYNYEINDLIIKRLNQQKEQLTERTILLMNHVLNAQHIWNSRLRGIESTFETWQIHDLNNWETINEENYKTSIQIVEGFPMDEEVIYTNSKNQKFTNKIKDIIYHIVNHSTYHRAQITSIAKENGVEPLSSDYIFYKR